MVLLHIALQEGFRKNTVILRLDGKTISRKSDVKTRTQIGFADSVELEREEGPAHIEMELSREGISGSIDLVVETDTYVGISIVGREVKFKVQNVPFGYL